MKLFTKLVPVIMAGVIAFSSSATAFGANIDNVPVRAHADVSLLAGDFDVSGTKLSADTPLPSSYSSKELGYTTGVKNQLYNTCWAYGSAASLESYLIKNCYAVSDFSPAHMNHWGTKRSDNTGWIREYYSGGYSYISLGYFSSWQGPRLNSDYPASTALSNFSLLDTSTKKQFSVNSIIYLDTKNVETVKTAVYNYGAVVGNYHVDDNYYNPETYAYYYNIEGLTTGQLNGHCISIVGWDDNFSKNNFRESARPENDGAWLCKNSWGDSWGDAGYFWISYEDLYIFDTKFGHSYAFTDAQPYSSRKTLYQNEVDGATYEFEYIDNFNTITYINIFDAQQDFDIVEKVNFETTSQGSEYRIFNVPLNADHTPVSSQARWEEIGNGVVDYQGYISVDTTDFEITGEKFAIGVQLIKNGSTTNTIGVSEWLTVNGGKYIFIPQSTHGMSYLVCDDTAPMDVMDFYKEAFDDEVGGTFVIKAVGSKREPLMGDVNFDSKLTIFDATDIQLHLALIKTLSDDAVYAGDMDKDGVLSIFDATTVQMMIAGIYEDAGNSDVFEDFE